MPCARPGCDRPVEIRIAYITASERWRVRQALIDRPNDPERFRREVVAFCLDHGRESWKLLRRSGTNPIYKRISKGEP